MLIAKHNVKKLLASYNIAMSTLPKVKATVDLNTYDAYRDIVYLTGDLLATVNGHSDTPTQEEFEFRSSNI